MGLFQKTKKEPKPQGGKLYRIINNISIVGLFLAVTLLILMVMKTIPWSSGMVGFVLAIAIVCFCLILALPWVRKLENKEFKILSYVFLGLVAFCCILWVIADIVVIKEFNAIVDVSSSSLTDEEQRKFLKGLVSSLKYLKTTLFITIQFSVASFIATSITKFRKTMIPFQAISYSAYAVCDFWISGIMLSLKIKSNIDFSKDLEISDIFGVNSGFLKFLVSKVMITILVVAIAYVIIAGIVIKKQEARRVNNMTEDIAYGSRDRGVENNEQVAPAKPESVEDKLLSLKKMLDGGLITQEEYDEKKAEILKDM